MARVLENGQRPTRPNKVDDFLRLLSSVTPAPAFTTSTTLSSTCNIKRQQISQYRRRVTENEMGTVMRIGTTETQDWPKFSRASDERIELYIADSLDCIANDLLSLSNSSTFQGSPASNASIDCQLRYCFPCAHVLLVVRRHLGWIRLLFFSQT